MRHCPHRIIFLELSESAELCQTSIPGDEQHPVLECPALQGVRTGTMANLRVMPLQGFNSRGNMAVVRL